MTPFTSRFAGLPSKIMMAKQLLTAALSRLQRGGLTIIFWDGDERTFGPDEPYFTLRIKDPSVVRSLLTNVSLTLGEAYADGRIDIEGPLTGLVRLKQENQSALEHLFGRLPRLPRTRNTRGSQRKQIAHHYDLGNEFYALWLDTGLTYSCAYFHSPEDTLESAQEHKIDYVLRKLHLRPGQRLLDIGSGWGTLLLTAAEKYEVHGLGVTLSDQQLAHAREAAGRRGLSDRVRFELANYQDLPERGERFDRIVSVGMFEHVGRGNHAAYYRAVHDMLVDGGVTVLHTITHQRETPNDPWIDKHIFPGGHVPSNREIMAALPDQGLRLVDYENLRPHYALTLAEWLRRYERHRDEVIAMFDERFYRMWRLWLSHSTAAFRYGAIDLSQYVLTKGVTDDLPLTRHSWYRE
ncbi:class I SAM-dependent methyltransferase [Pseudonocardiaceae bacterium YIM PH 21723]|nr:class I SAM-dependent methyltransferase [Pseudonocardiaceae bacterium YIM PH 21723]